MWKLENIVVCEYTEKQSEGDNIYITYIVMTMSPSAELNNVSGTSFIKVYIQIKMSHKILFITWLFSMHRPTTDPPHTVHGLLACPGSGFSRQVLFKDIQNGYITLKTRLSYLINQNRKLYRGT